MAEPLKILIFGAAGGVGARAVDQALARGHTVRAVEPFDPDGSDTREGVEWRRADVINEDLAPLMDGVDAVISALGLPFSAKNVADPPPLYSQGTLNIVDAMRASTVRRLVVISASFVDETNRGPVWFRLPAMISLKRIFDEMRSMERILKGTEVIEWTATRPGWLMPAEPSGRYVVTEDVIPENLIRTRTGDLAEFMVRCIEDGSWIRGTPAICAEEDEDASGPEEVIRAAMG